MPIVNIICSICTEVYNNSDNVFGTNCGHLFHNACLNNWLARDNSCPQCRHDNPRSYKLHLSFNELEQEPQIENLPLKIKSSEEKVAELTIQNKENESNFLKLQEQCSKTLSSTRETKEIAGQMKNSEKDFLQLQAQYTDISESRKQLAVRINQLYIENESILAELQLAKNENEQLKLNLGGELFVLPSNALGEQIKSIEQKIKIISQELEKEVNISTKLATEKMKLQSYIDGYHSAVNKENNASKPIRSNSKNNVTKRRFRKNSPQNYSSYEASVIIKGFPLSQLTAPLENVVVKLASKMNIILVSDDLMKVDVVEADLQNNSASLTVQFKKIEKKFEFLANKRNLNDTTDCKAVSIEELMNLQLRELFIYAKNQLHNRGLIYFYFENNKIFAKKNRMHSEAVHIQSKAQVDNIALIYDFAKTLKLTKGP